MLHLQHMAAMNETHGPFSSVVGRQMVMLEFNDSERSFLVGQHHQQRLDSMYCNHFRSNDPTNGGPLVTVGLPPRLIQTYSWRQTCSAFCYCFTFCLPST
ncbi:hypothetical protein N7G274_006607 [Stereocaulon virgatum]|uniref:Uncharacterized protein n=1 Tax=Stereocaulon virgatum TaxID=373712 RepID=A0ABR4ABB6_9LECA